MNYTPNHHLPQWVSSDRVLMEDFNQMNKNLESSLTANASAAADAKAAANSAQTTASAAQTAANEAKTAVSEMERPYIYGSYVGTGRNISINLPFQPSFLIISGMRQTQTEEQDADFTRYFAIAGGDGGELRGRVHITSFGFAVYYANNAGLNWPMLTDEGRVYHYIAFR